MNIARKNHDQYIVEAILGHQFNPTPAQKGLYLRVKWEGYPEPTLEPRENFIHVEAFHQYCRKHKLRKFIPQCHRIEETVNQAQPDHVQLHEPNPEEEM